MENLVSLMSILKMRDLRILVTGHTGFKGSWLCEWLLQVGGSVSGLGLSPEKPNSLFDILNLEHRLSNHILCDIRDINGLTQAVSTCNPDLVFHLAAQALVRRSYSQPLLTWETNVTGTLNLLEAVRTLEKPITVVVVTTDKVYKNREWEFSYREDDELGGRDPYSASKSACELAVSSWRDSFAEGANIKVVTARAGNVIGGGDFSEDRIVPDCYSAWQQGKAVVLRNPMSIRPWQHVLEPLSGYLALAVYTMASTQLEITTCNFGPGDAGERTVESLVRLMATHGSNRNLTVTSESDIYEARNLTLSIERARSILGWIPCLSFEKMIAWADKCYTSPQASLPDLVRQQIIEYCYLRSWDLVLR